jgi:Asp-tRNA(Asn)/Glu-tRNA(Gln) amidotransferase A subunit family amidase
MKHVRRVYRINAYDKQGPTINCIITINPRALEEADALDVAFKRSGAFVGPMHGIPIVVKDEIDTAGMPTTEGTLVFKDYRPTKDAFVFGRPYSEPTLIKLAYAYEQATHHRLPPKTTPPLGSSAGPTSARGMR